MSHVASVTFSAEVTKITSRIGVSSTHLPFCFYVILKLSEMAILSKIRKPGNFESQTSQKLALSIFQALVLISFFVDLSFLNQTLLIFQLYVIQTWKTRPIFKISVKGYFSLI